MAGYEPKIYEQTESIPIYCVTARSFPEGVQEAHEELHKVTPEENGRRFFGISWGGESITYKAGATEPIKGELKDKNLEKFIIKAGKYLFIDVDGVENVREAIRMLINDSRIDPNGYCVEIYNSDNAIRCMVTMKEVCSYSRTARST